MRSNNFSIQFVSKVTGLNPHTIRAWEKRYSAVTPERLINGRRVYTQNQIEKLSILSKLVNHGSSISTIANFPLDRLKEIHDEYVSKNVPEVSAVHAPAEKIDLHTTLQNLTLAIKGFRLEIVSHELDKIIASMSPRDFALSVFTPLIYEVGVQVDNGSLTIAQEHAFSALVKFHLGKILFSYGNHEDTLNSGKTIIICAPEGEIHEFGLYISALLCLHYGIKIYFLGGNLPLDSLTMTMNQIEHDIVIVGCSQYFRDNNYNFLQKYIIKLMESTNLDSEVWVGGIKPFNVFSNSSKIKFLSTLQVLDSELSKLV